MSYLKTGTLVNAKEIRDTNPFNATEAVPNTGNPLFVVVRNGLNQQVSVQLQGGGFGDGWANVGSAIVVAAGATGAAEVAALWPKVRAAVTAAVAPTTGAVSVYFSSRADG